MDELLFAIKKGRLSARGKIGLNYAILNHLVAMENSPLLDLFEMSLDKGKLPTQ